MDKTEIDSLSAALAEIRERSAARTGNAPGFGADPADFRRLLATVEAVLKLGDRSGEAQDPHLPGHIDVHMIREAITAELTGRPDD